MTAATKETPVVDLSIAFYAWLAGGKQGLDAFREGKREGTTYVALNLNTSHPLVDVCRTELGVNAVKAKLPFEMVRVRGTSGTKKLANGRKRTNRKNVARFEAILQGNLEANLDFAREALETCKGDEPLPDLEQLRSMLGLSGNTTSDEETPDEPEATEVSSPLADEQQQLEEAAEALDQAEAEAQAEADAKAEEDRKRAEEEARAKAQAEAEERERDAEADEDKPTIVLDETQRSQFQLHADTTGKPVTSPGTGEVFHPRKRAQASQPKERKKPERPAPVEIDMSLPPAERPPKTSWNVPREVVTARWTAQDKAIKTGEPQLVGALWLWPQGWNQTQKNEFHAKRRAEREARERAEAEAQAQADAREPAEVEGGEAEPGKTLTECIVDALHQVCAEEGITVPQATESPEDTQAAPDPGSNPDTEIFILEPAAEDLADSQVPDEPTDGGASPELLELEPDGPTGSDELPELEPLESQDPAEPQAAVSEADDGIRVYTIDEVPEKHRRSVEAGLTSIAPVMQVQALRYLFEEDAAFPFGCRKPPMWRFIPRPLEPVSPSDTDSAD